MFQLYVLPLCFVCFVCFVVCGVIAPRRSIQNNQCLIGRPHIHREGCHWLYSHVLVVWFAIVLCMLCVFCRSRGGCPTSVYTKQPVSNRTATYTQREFVIDCVLMFQLYVFPLCVVCFMCFAVHGLIAPRRFIQNNQCFIGRPHIQRESLSLTIFSCFNGMFCHCAVYALCVLPFAGWLSHFSWYKTTSV